MYATISPRRRMGGALVFFLLAVTAPAPASAGNPAESVNPTEGVNTGEPVNTAITDRYCPLERIGTQLVRCDNLTGAGVPAPYWIPEQ